MLLDGSSSRVWAGPPEPGLKRPFMLRSGAGVENRPVESLTRPRRARSRLRGRSTRFVLLVLALAALPEPPHATADDRRDHERARAAVRAGEVLPLSVLLERLHRVHPGQVLELGLDREDGRWIYEVKLLQSDGQLLRVEVDAATGAVLAARRRNSREHRPEKDAAR
jgi:uncharacterized membrane protein YkoI